MSTSKKWTPEEDSILVARVNANPKSIIKTLEEVSQELHKSKYAVHYRWYQVLRSKRTVEKNGLWYSIKRMIKKVW